MTQPPMERIRERMKDASKYAWWHEDVTYLLSLWKRQDVEDVLEAHEYFKHGPDVDMGERYADLAARIAALLPPETLPSQPLSSSSQEPSMSDTEARVSLLEATVKNLAAFVASLPQPEIKPIPGVDLWQYHQELWKQVHGDKASGYDLSRYEYYTNPAFAAQVANNEDFKLWTAARKANIVPDSPAGLFLLLYLSGEGYEHAEKVVGGENGKRFVSWLLAYRGYPAPR